MLGDNTYVTKKEAVNLGNREAVNIGYTFAEFLKNKGRSTCRTF